MSEIMTAETVFATHVITADQLRVADTLVDGQGRVTAIVTAVGEPFPRTILGVTNTMVPLEFDGTVTVRVSANTVFERLAD